MLPEEERSRSQIAAVLKDSSAEMSRWLEFAITIVPPVGFKSTRSANVDEVVVFTALGLYAKALKTFRAVQIVCESGLTQDGMALTRVLFETTLAIMFILQKQSRLRARMYHAHIYVKLLRLLLSWKTIKGFKRKATKADIQKAERAVGNILNGLTGLRRWPKKEWYSPTVPAAIKALRRARVKGTGIASAERDAIQAASNALKDHWSGKNIYETAKAVRWLGAYETFYRYSSSFSHVGDFHKHAKLKQNGSIKLLLIPAADQETLRTMDTAMMFLSSAAAAIDKRFQLGRSAELEAMKPSIIARVKGRKKR